MERISYQDIPDGMFEQLMSVEDYISQSGLELKLLEMIRLRAAQLNQCAYCVDMHYKELQHAGESELRLASLIVWRETHFFTSKERAVLDFTEKLTILENEGITDEIYNHLLDHFNKREVAFLSLAIAQINTWTRLMKTFRFTPGNYQVPEPKIVEEL